MIYGSVCSGIEAATAAWHGLGWKPAFFSEIEAFPRAVLAHHYPTVPLHGDFTTIEADQYGAIDLLVGGTPCQSFSVAGLRGGLGDDRGNLALEYLRLAQRKRPRWLVWENVPGVLSINGGRDFGSIIGGMVELGYGISWRVLDAQYFGVPQRRRRVFVVGYFGDWRPAVAVLFERESLRGDSPPRRQAGKGIAPTISARPTGGGGLGTDFDLDGELVARPLNDLDGTSHSLAAKASAAGYHDPSVETFVAHALRGEGFDESENGSGRDTPLVPVAFPANLSGTQSATTENLAPAMGAKNPTAVVLPIQEIGKRTGVSTTDPRAGSGIGGEADPMYTLQAGAQHGVEVMENQRHELRLSDVMDSLKCGGGKPGQGYPAVMTFESRFARNGRGAPDDVVPPLKAQSGETGKGDAAPLLALASCVRRLTPRECERLQGFEDDYTLVPHRGKPAADGPRYKALGNSMAVPCMRWIGERIQLVENILKNTEAA